MILVGIDVGGTFTDFIYLDHETGKTDIHKVSTTPDDPSIGVITGLLELADKGKLKPKNNTQVFHGTTTATNAVLEGKGACTGMITNQGFRDIIHIGRHQRPDHYSIMQEIPWQNRPLVQRQYRKTVKGRLTPPTGHELELSLIHI